MQALSEIVDFTLLFTLALIFGATMLGAYLRSSRRDPCLSSFDDFHVTLERSNGKIVWGTLELEPSGLELRYRDTVQDANHVESSYLLYASEYPDIQAIFRYVDDLGEEGKARRQKDLDRSFHPGPGRRMMRNVHHFFTLANESLGEVVGVLMGSLRKSVSAGRYITDTGETHLKKLGVTVVGRVGSSYDPLLERCIGKKVVVELIEGDEAHEHVGILKNYSPEFMTLLDVQFPQKQLLTLAQQKEAQARAASVVVEARTLKVTNHTNQPLLLQSLILDGQEDLLNVVVGGQETIELHPEKEFSKVSLNVRVVREVDMIVPRTRCIVRHQADRYEPSVLPEIIFDLGVLLGGNSIADAREARLRKSLQEQPKSAMAANNLGALLVQKGQYEEAEQWLDRAYELRYALPDNGRRTLMLLHELRRRRAKAPEQIGALVAQQYKYGVNGYAAVGQSTPAADFVPEGVAPVQTQEAV
jgi:hypothetical protein